MSAQIDRFTAPESRHYPRSHHVSPASTDAQAGHAACSPVRIRATWSGTSSVADASEAFGFSRAKGYDLVRRGQFPCRVLQIGRGTRVVTASLLRVLESGDPEYNPVTG
ncbi:helix-turn-helix domain-containing protein [Streptomyces sp. 21So2-11]|uniref:helix-turn-helix domain-containing protein n=1 Tax=Streptomyces sp. 21So2-11 TaxID=3144408 RepID=UPI003219FE3C